MTHSILDVSGKFGPFMSGGGLEYDFDPDPTSRPSWVPLSACIYHLGELCRLSESVIPGFGLKLSHFGVSGHSQFLFKNKALLPVTVGDNPKYVPKADIARELPDLVYPYLEKGIFDLV